MVYLLHGFSDDETAWVQFGGISETADRAIADREIPAMIIVMPDAKVSWYINDLRGEERYEDMVFSEFIPYIDATYRSRAKKEFRAVAGLSMGGYGSLVWSLHHPDQFASCAAFSPGVFTDQEITEMPEKQYNNFFKQIFIDRENDKRVNDHWKNNSPIDLMNILPMDQISKVRYYINCGDDDFLYKGNSTLHIVMRDRNISHEYRVRNGSHSWNYWRTYIIDGLRFIGDGFNRQ